MTGCAAPAARPTHVPAFPEAHATAHPSAWAAFELSLRSDGSVARSAVRTIGWDASGAGATLFVALRNVAAETTWEPQDEGTRAGGEPRHVVLVLDGAARPLLGRALPAAVRRRIDAALHTRRRALEALGSARHVNEHALDCAWMSVSGLRSGAPFLHDDVDGWLELEPRLRVAEQRDGGVWVCRAPRGTHQGSFVFLDAARDVLGVRRYILGE
jgi:hypothetical protein